LFALLAVVVMSCVIRIGEGGDPGASGDTSQATTGGSGGNQDAGAKTPEEEAAELFGQMDPQELSLASAKAGLMTCSLVASVESSGLDPATLDEATLTQLMEQYAPAAAAEADAWLASIDPSMLPLAVTPRFECQQQFGCESTVPCLYKVGLPEVPHLCYVVDCGAAKCPLCPPGVADLLKNIIVKAWCSYVCVEIGTVPPKTYAVGAGGISKFQGSFVGPICVPNW
jgi:hypothetical protein